MRSLIPSVAAAAIVFGVRGLSALETVGQRVKRRAAHLDSGPCEAAFKRTSGVRLSCKAEHLRARPFLYLAGNRTGYHEETETRLPGSRQRTVYLHRLEWVMARHGHHNEISCCQRFPPLSADQTGTKPLPGPSSFQQDYALLDRVIETFRKFTTVNRASRWYVRTPIIFIR